MLLFLMLVFLLLLFLLLLFLLLLYLSLVYLSLTYLSLVYLSLTYLSLLYFLRIYLSLVYLSRIYLLLIYFYEFIYTDSFYPIPVSSASPLVPQEKICYNAVRHFSSADARSDLREDLPLRIVCIRRRQHILRICYNAVRHLAAPMHPCAYALFARKGTCYDSRFGYRQY